MSEKVIITKEDIVITKGTVFKLAPWKTERVGFHGEYVIGFSDDSVGFLTVSEEDANSAPDVFIVTEV